MTRLLTEHRTAEVHRGSRVAWLRAAVLGANDGLISTASLIVVAGRRTCRRAQVALRPRLRSTSRRVW
jgi:VIT1/CCC1 family predicted Fe2+/Mn2+ transporter